MAGDWIKMQTHLWDHPKVVRIVSAICPQGVRDMSARCRVIGALFRTWGLADSHSEDGILDGYDADALDAAVGIEGWSLNLQHVGWLIVEPQRLIVPRFEEHNGASAKRRAEDAKRKKSVRKMSAERPQKSGQNADQRREEKRREDIETPTPFFPENLQTPEFEKAWSEWQKHRKEIKHPLTPTQEQKQLKAFSEWGPRRAIAAIEHTILKGWQGVKEPDADSGSADRQSPKRESMYPDLTPRRTGT